MKNVMSFKAKIRNIAKSKNIPAQVVLQNYLFERLLVRLAASEYKDKFVLKGGLLVSALVGLDKRVTMDMDATLKNMPLNPDVIRVALNAICSLDMNDEITFEIGRIAPIRDDDVYGGFRVPIVSKYETLITPLSIDVTAGDVITPQPVKQKFSYMFEEGRQYELWAYNIETILAEKVETILRRGVFNTRPRDFYDIFVLTAKHKVDQNQFLKALEATANHRHTMDKISDISAIIRTLSSSSELQSMWDKYCRSFSYANGIAYAQIVDVVASLTQGGDKTIY